MVEHACTIVRKGTVTEITCPFDASVFENLHVWPSTLHHLAGVFKFLYSGDYFSKSVNAVRSGYGRENRREKTLFGYLTFSGCPVSVDSGLLTFFRAVTLGYRL